MPATIVLVAVNLAIFAYMAVNQPGVWTGRVLVGWGGNLGRLALGSEPWRLLSALFLHGDVVHLAGNLFCLFVWGGVTERAAGTIRFVATYFTAGILANLASASINPSIVSVGASGATAGLLGFMVAMWLKGDGRVGASDLVFNIGLNVAISFLPSVDWVAHIAGFVVGIVLGLLLFRKSDMPAPG